MPSPAPTRPGEKPPLFLLGTQLAQAGAQQVLLAQALWFKAQGYPVTAAFFYDKENLAGKWRNRVPFDLLILDGWRMGDGALRNALRLAGALARLFRALKQRRIRVIETFTFHSNLLGIPCARLAGVPVRVATNHGQLVESGVLQRRVHGALMNSHLTSITIAVSEPARQAAIAREGTRPERILKIDNGIWPLPAATAEERRGLRAELGVPPGGSLLLAVGRLIPEKGHRYLLDALPQILARHPQTVLALAGDGPLRAELESRVERLGVAAAVRFLGVREDVPRLLHGADVFVMPSVSEGLPVALLEAMSAARPVVATQVGGMPGVVTEGETGYCVPPGLAEPLAGAILALLDDEALRRKLGAAGQALYTARYTVEHMCSQYETIFLAQLQAGVA